MIGRIATPLATVLALVAGAVMAHPAVVVAQADEPIDQVVAVVGNSAITFTQVQEEFYSRIQAEGRQPPTDSNEVQRQMQMLVDTLIDAQLLYEQAARDTNIKVTPIEVSDAVDATLQQMRAGLPEGTTFLAELRKAGFLGVEDYRRWLSQRQYRELVTRRYITRLSDRGLIDPIPPTEKEVRAYYEANLDRLPRRPPTRSIRQLVIAPKPNAAAKAKALKLADSLVAALRDGADFEVLAKRFSKDPVSAEKGGDLGWQRPGGGLVRQFERVAFSLPLGTISDPVETPFGYHIIQVERIQPTERQIRHILITAPIDSAAALTARKLADSVRTLIVGGASFDSLQAIYHDESELREGRSLELPALPPAYRDVLTDAKVGDLTPVVELPVPGGSPLASKYAILKVTAAAPAGPPPFDRMREQLRTVMAQAAGREHYLAQLRAKAYISKRPL